MRTFAPASSKFPPMAARVNTRPRLLPTGASARSPCRALARFDVAVRLRSPVAEVRARELRDGNGDAVATGESPGSTAPGRRPGCATPASHQTPATPPWSSTSFGRRSTRRSSRPAMAPDRRIAGERCRHRHAQRRAAQPRSSAAPRERTARRRPELGFTPGPKFGSSRPRCAPQLDKRAPQGKRSQCKGFPARPPNVEGEAMNQGGGISEDWLSLWIGLAIFGLSPGVP